MSSRVAAERAAALRTVLGIAWVLTIAVTAIGHATALRNASTVAVSLATLALYRREWRALPCKGVVGALVVWAVASLLWSPAPDVTAGKLRTDLVTPLVAGAAIFCFVRAGGGLRPVVQGLGLGIVALATLSAFAYLPNAWVPGGWTLEQSAGIVRPLPHWYPGPGDASMFAILAIAPLTVAWTSTRSRDRAASIAAGVLLAFVLVTTNNRNAVLVAPLVLILQWLLDRRAAVAAVAVPRPRARPARRLAAIVAAAIVVVVALAALLEFGARQRLQYLHRPMPGDSAAIEMLEADTRPAIWRYYFARGLEHPWIGMGFGRTVPGIGWHTQDDAGLAAVEPNAYIHAHDVGLNWWLQLGLVGLSLLVAAIGSTMVAARRLSRAAGDTIDATRLRHALIATLAATLARNLTDDFLVYGMATAFCVVVGALLGELSRLAAVRPSLRAEAGQHRRDGADADREVERE